MSNCPTGPNPDGGPLLIGSQFVDEARGSAGYYGFNGKIDGVRISDTAKSANAIP